MKDKGLGPPAAGKDLYHGAPPVSDAEAFWAGLFTFLLLLGWPVVLHFLAVGE